MSDLSHDVLSEAGTAWTVKAERGACWCAWDGEVVVYDDLSGDTFKLEPRLAAIFFRLADHPATTTELVRHLSQSFDLEQDRRTLHWMELALNQLQRSGLVEPFDAQPSNGAD